MKELTVFTPSYNRKELLARCYESMKRQTYSDFIWMIIDDGSTDGTADAVSKWQTEKNKFEIKRRIADGKSNNPLRQRR